MPREDARTRGRRLVAEGRLQVLVVDRAEIAGVIRGDSGRYHYCGWRPDRGWWCECEARTQCGHLYALQLVTSEPASKRATA
jgi:hypothetical protein